MLIFFGAGPPEVQAVDKRPPTVSTQDNDMEHHEMQLAAQLSQQSPQVALRNPIIAHAFSHYVDVVAPWYDLNDSRCTFSATVAVRALNFPVLFRAIIALSCCHLSVVTNQSEEFGYAFHAACVEDLIRAVGSSPTFSANEEYLAAACLLQLYEILDCKNATPGAEYFSMLMNCVLFDRSRWSSR
jgi:hypothetical protein